MNDKKLRFFKGNAKLEKQIYTFSLPAGWTCPGALHCFARSNQFTGKITHGKDQTFTCFSATSESIYPNVRKSRWHNFNLLKGKTMEQMVDIILDSIPIKSSILRLHVSGDFFNQSYFDAWLEVAKQTPSKIFYAYTKSLPFIINRLGDIPANLRFTASRGGKFDKLIDLNKLVSATVVFSLAEAKEKKLKLDHDDSLAIKATKSFGLLLHGKQPAGTASAAALRELKRVGLGKYV